MAILEDIVVQKRLFIRSRSSKVIDFWYQSKVHVHIPIYDQ